MAKELLERRQTENKIAALMDSQYIAGARFGWNCGVQHDALQLRESIENRRHEIVEANKHD